MSINQESRKAGKDIPVPGPQGSCLPNSISGWLIRDVLIGIGVAIALTTGGCAGLPYASMATTAAGMIGGSGGGLKVEIKGVDNSVHYCQCKTPCGTK